VTMVFDKITTEYIFNFNWLLRFVTNAMGVVYETNHNVVFTNVNVNIHCVVGILPIFSYCKLICKFYVIVRLWWVFVDARNWRATN